MLSNYDIRARARQRVKGPQWNVAMKLTLVLIIWQILSMGYGQFSGTNSQVADSVVNWNLQGVLAQFVGFLTQSMLSDIIFGMFTLGSIWAFIEWRRNDEAPTEPLKDSFRFWRGDTIMDAVVLLGIRFLFTFLWMWLLILPGVVKSLSYSQASFIYAEDVKAGHKITSLTEYITRSRELMIGHKMQLFLLQLSFIGWWIVVGLTLGLAAIYVVPYYNSAMAEFYIELQRERHYGSRRQEPTADENPYNEL